MAGARAWPKTHRCRPRSATAGGPRSRRCAARPAPRPAAPSCRARPRAGRRRCGARPQTRARSSAPAALALGGLHQPPARRARAGPAGVQQECVDPRRHAGRGAACLPHQEGSALRTLGARLAAGHTALSPANAGGRRPLRASRPRALNKGCHAPRRRYTRPLPERCMRRAARTLSAPLCVHRGARPACPCRATRTPHSLWRAQHAHPNSARSSGRPAGPNAHPAGPGAPVHQEALAARARRRALRVQAAHAQLARQALQVGVAHEARLARPRHRCEAVRRMRSGARSSATAAPADSVGGC